MTTKSANAASETSRDALLQTGLELFGQHGYNTVTVRQICEAAEVNIAQSITTLAERRVFTLLWLTTLA